MTPEKEAYNYSIRLLSKKDYSIHKMKEKLRGRKFESSVIEETIEVLLEQRYLREELYTEARIKGFMRKNCGPNFIKRKLAEECIEVSHDQIEEIFEDNHFEIREQKKALIEKKMRRINLDDLNYEEHQKLLAKIYRFVASKGHDINDVKELMNELNQEKYQ